MKRIRAVILAAGSSRRLGFSKLTLKIDGESVIRRSVRPFLREDVEKVIVVTGHEGWKIERELIDFKVDLVHNRRYRDGMSTSVRAALPFLGNADAILFHLGDKPFITPDQISIILDEYKGEGARIIVPVCDGRKGHPVLIDANIVRDEIGAVEGDKGLREVIEKHKGDVVFIQSDEGSLFDIDTLREVDCLRKRGYTVEKGER
ncbi:MAG: Molybdenum cofactor cytidylyltransferase [Syntrophorhabdus sp. PtaU1.Bin153]|nr:MAG: Molybdenum cofactor cytidylyltransferase [Syntrophorhabdus sp. PtaU1.Bin153]